jgi:hypothetical protein
VSTGGRRPSRASAMRSTLYTGGTAPYPARHPENSGGEAATFPKALDTTNKEESICMPLQKLAEFACVGA